MKNKLPTWALQLIRETEEEEKKVRTANPQNGDHYDGVESTA